MKKTNLKYIIFSIIAFVLAIGINVQTVHAASGSVSASGGKTVNVGDTVSITFNVNADVTMYGIEFGVSYDANVLEFTGGSNANGGGGSIKVASGASSNSASYTLNFKAKQPGTSSISVSNGIGVGEADEFQLTTSGTSVTVAAPVQHSKDNSLKSLTISPGTLSPGFSPSTTKYTATVSSSTTKLVVSASPSHSAAKVTSVSGGDSLSVGANDVKVVVQAEDGSTATYTITVTREQGASTPTPTPTPTETESIEPTPTPPPELPPVEVKIDGNSLIINSDFESSSMPESFRKETLEYDGRQISGAVSTDGDLTLVYLTEEDEETGKFYIYNKDTDTFSEYQELEARGGRYIILPLGEDITIPDYFIETSFTMNGKEITGWQLNGLEDEEYYIVYAVDGRGNKDLYNVDLQGGTFQRFSVDAMNALLSGSASDEDILALQASVGTLQDDLDKSNENLSNLQNKYNTDMSSRLKIIVALAVLSLILLIVLVNVLLKNKFLKADLAEIEGYNDDNDLLDMDEYEELASSDSLISSDSDNDWTKEYAATKDDYYFEEESNDSLNNDEEPSPNVQVQDDTNTSEIQDEEIKPEEADASLTNQDKKEGKTTDLENASLEDIFEYLNVDDLDDDDLN